MVPASKPVSLEMLMLFLMLVYILSNLKVSVGMDTISPGRPLYDNETLISKGRKFVMGFFRPGAPEKLYVGIWYYHTDNESRTIIWVATRETPIQGDYNVFSESTFVLNVNGSLIHLNNSNQKILEVKDFIPLKSVPNKGVLHDDGNFVLSDGQGVIWQSFDHPTDTWLPGAKLGIDGSLTNKLLQLTSWKDSDDPAPGNFSLGINVGTSPELFMWMNQSKTIWRSGAWNGYNFDTFPSLSDDLMYFSYIITSHSNYFTFNISTSTNFRYAITPYGELGRWRRIEGAQWELLSSYPGDTCNSFGLCGPNSFCNSRTSPPCICYKGFKPRSVEEWQFANWSGGCITTKPLQCSNGFYPVPGISMPINSQSLDLDSAQICESSCLGNCSCSAYAYDGSRCSLWTGYLLGSLVRENSQEDLFVRSSEILLAGDKAQSNAPKQSNVPIAVFVTIPLVIIISLAFLVWRIWRRKHMKKEVGATNEVLLFLNLEISSKKNTDSNKIDAGSILEREEKAFDLPQFSFSSISASTNNFSPANKLGEGGFGPVYKGNLFDGNSVAVKRLSKRSEQGLEELRNETVLIAKLQHRNLVRLLGCCIEQDEKILIYEYMPNKSLDCFIFDPSKQVLLDWTIRVQIIEGIAQGLLYLHQHSRLRIVHRDLKASNILLDDEMNPKISDFGMARIFGGDVLQANTNRIVGTYGYMSPEYAMEGLFSIKSDVFAFGVLLLEILSGKKNTGFRHSDCLSLLGYAWELWKTERVLELIDSNLELPASFLPLRFIHVGLLCVQESPADRPTMSDVLAMFGNELFKLVSPKRPAFTSGGSLGSGINKAEHCSVNDILTVSVMNGR